MFRELQIKYMVLVSRSVREVFHLLVCFVFIEVYVFDKEACIFKFKKDREIRHSFAPRPLLYKLQQNVLNFHSFCVSWSSPNIDLGTCFLDFEN